MQHNQNPCGKFEMDLLHAQNSWICQVCFLPASVCDFTPANGAKHAEELGKHAGWHLSRQTGRARSVWASRALKDLAKLWNTAYCSLIHFCVNKNHALNLSGEIRWISLLLSFCQCRFTVSSRIRVQPVPTPNTFPRREKLIERLSGDKDCERCHTGNSDSIKSWELVFFFFFSSLRNVITVVTIWVTGSRFQMPEGTLSPSSPWADCVHWKVQVLIKFYKLTSVFFFRSFFCCDNTDPDNAAHAHRHSRSYQIWTAKVSRKEIQFLIFIKNLSALVG